MPTSDTPGLSEVFTHDQEILALGTLMHYVLYTGRRDRHPGIGVCELTHGIRGPGFRETRPFGTDHPLKGRMYFDVLIHRKAN
ncbi:protein of unknown function (plasmid) [Paraburkholderia dioscoreae]|uniref:Uncharacterized protein n=1 Tax=Paraburkholderia dioscoreae TaxID=2604047 RepID=A0A5Q4ZGK8_9BURK|nr:protein of unknown function [Paraburkholderia dioscoreae]